MISNTSQPLSVPSAGTPAAGPQPASPAPQQGPSLWDLAGQGLVAGPGAAVERVYGRVAPWAGLEGGQDAIRAATTIRAETQNLIRSLAVNPRFPVAEMKRLKSEIDIAPEIFDSGMALQTRMRAVDRVLRARLAKEIAVAEDPRQPKAARQNAIQAATDINYFLKRLGVPEGNNQTAGPQPGTVEDGYRFKGGDPGDSNSWEKVR